MPAGMLAQDVIEDTFRHGLKCFVWNTFPIILFFTFTFFSEMIPFMVSFKKKYLIVWEEVRCGLGMAKAVVALQIFIH